MLIILNGKEFAFAHSLTPSLVAFSCGDSANPQLVGQLARNLPL